MEDPHQMYDFTWSLIEDYHKSGRSSVLVKHLLDSYNDFVVNKMEQCIEGFMPLMINHPKSYLPEHECYKYVLLIEMKNVCLSKPMIQEKDGSVKVMTPNDARQRNFTYGGALTVEVHVTAKTFDEQQKTYLVETQKFKHVSLGKLPVMVGSRYCVTHSHVLHDEDPYDMGGYFIITGNEKVVISQDRIAENKTHVFTNNKIAAYSTMAEIRSVTENKFSVPKITTLKLSAKPNQFGHFIRVNIHHIKHDIPLFILFRALGVESDKEILKYIVYDLDNAKNAVVVNEMIGSIEDGNVCTSRHDAIEYLARYLNTSGAHTYKEQTANQKLYRLKVVENILQKEFLPHVGPDLKSKALYLGSMAHKLILCFKGITPFDDRDSYKNKRVDTPGALLGNIFRQYFGKLIKDTKNMVLKEINTGSWKATGKFIHVINKVILGKVIKPSILEGGMKYCLSTGNWGIKTTKPKQGVAQVGNRQSYNSMVSHLRRINTPIEKSGKLVQPRKLNSTQWGIICPAETPEGASVGLVKNMAIMAGITLHVDSTHVLETLRDHGVEIFTETGYLVDTLKIGARVLLNGNILGIHRDPKALYDTLKGLKRRGVINVYTGIYWNVLDKEIHVCTEGGRCVRPLFIVNDRGTLNITPEFMRAYHEASKKGKGMSWNDVVSGLKTEQGEPVIEYLDVEECNNALIAMSMKDLMLERRYTHMEMHPSTILGVMAGAIPFSNHNQAPRNCYQCLWLEEDVLMADGTRKKIKDVNIGDEVVTFDIKTMAPSYTKVVHQYVRPTDKKMFELTTISGRKIVATSNHPLMTSKGWKKMEDIQKGDEMGIYLHNMTSVSHEVEEYVVLDEALFEANLKEVGVNPSLITKHGKKLKDLGLMPLMSTHPKLPTIARIAGYIQTDGALNVYNKKHGGMTPQAQANFGSLLDADMFEADLEFLGFDKVVPTFEDREIHGSRHQTYKISHNGVFPTLLVALGFHIGKKADRPRKPIPNWIMQGSKLVKKEYMSGWQGGDGNQVYVQSSNKYKFQTQAVYQSITPEHEVSLVHYMTQLETLYKEMGVTTTGVRIMPGRPQYNKNRIGVYFENTEHNFINIMKNVGYRYADDKCVKTGKVMEYILARDNNKCTTNYPTFRDSIKSASYSIFIPVASKREVPNVMISDITVESDNHSFVTSSGFMSCNSAMGKQAIGVYARNYQSRFDTVAHVLNYPQKPLVYTKISNLIHTNEMPCGVNVIVAIMTFTGYNQEDSLIMNQSSIERGLFGSVCYKTFKEQSNKNHSSGEEEYFCKPDIDGTKGKRPYNYEKLAEDGFVPENTYVKAGDVIIGKCLPQKVGTAIVHKDTSVALKNNESGFVDRNACHDRVFINTNGDGYNFCKVRVRSDRIPTIGDKFCVPEHTEVLTLGGWKTIDKVSKGEDILQLDPHTGVASYAPILNHYAFDNRDDLYYFAGETIDLMTTSEHKLYASVDGGKTFDLMVARDCVHKPLVMKKSATTVIPHNDGEDLSNCAATAVLLGAWLHRGYLDVETLAVVYHTSVPEHLEEIVAVLVSHKVDMEVDRVRLSVKVFDPWLYGYFKEHQNRVAYSTCLFGLSTHHARTCVRFITDGKSEVILTHERASELQRLVVHAGGSLDIIGIDPRRCLARIHWEEPLEQVTVTTERYLGPVYCVEVPTHVFYVRHRGKCMWTGNSSRHGQKGTVGMVYRQEDMPFTSSGLVPDIIVNPHAIPSRMTIAQLMECIMGKGCCALGTFGDATPFTDLSVDQLAETLGKQGMEMYGNELMYNSRTGEQLHTNIFIGPTYYQRLKHMVNDKCHCLTGDHEVLTTEGWVPIPDVTKDHKVATLKNGVLVYDNPIDVLHFPHYIGKMVHVKTDDIELDVTLNHRMWASVWDGRGFWSDFGFYEAADLIGESVRYASIDGPYPSVVHDAETVYAFLGSVYCLQVPSEVFYVRKKGYEKGCWTGNSRSSNGPVVMLTRQPAEGRARDGGLRLGEMEVECKWAHGAMSFLKERFMECSDNFRVHVCRKCGMFATVNPDKNIYLCKPCKNVTHFAEIRIPYAFKLFMQEIQAMSIGTSFMLQNGN